MPFNFKFDVTVHHDVTLHLAPDVVSRLERAIRQLGDLQMATAQEIKDVVQQLKDEVAAQRGDIASMRTFVAGLEAAVKQQLDLANASDEIKQAVADVFGEVKANSQEIKNAIDTDPTT